MIDSRTLILFLSFRFFQYTQAQSSFPSQPDIRSSNGMNIQPNLSIVIVILAIIFSISFTLLMYCKFCSRANAIHHHQSILDGLIRSSSRFSGIDKTVIESLPFFRFSLLKGFKEGLECSVCLSRFEDVEILRLLPKCKHVFHINCVDQWLEKQSSCPLCRQKVSVDDVSSMTHSSSLRFLCNSLERRDELKIKVFVQREESRRGSSRFSTGNSFRTLEKGKKEKELLVQETCQDDLDEENGKMLHRFNHKIIVSDFVFKNRWSNVSSSDLMFLNSEMISSISSDRLSYFDQKKEKESEQAWEIKEAENTNIKEEMERNRELEISNVSKMENKYSKATQNYEARILNPREMRIMSDITGHPRSRDFRINDSLREYNTHVTLKKEEKMKRLWYRIARRTAAQWFVNREKGSQPSTSQIVDL